MTYRAIWLRAKSTHLRGSLARVYVHSWPGRPHREPAVPLPVVDQSTLDLGGGSLMLGFHAKSGLFTLAAVLSLATATPRVHGATVGGWQWPLRPAPDRVVRDFDPPAQPWLAGNRGIDLAGHPGERVRAAGAGVVSFAGVIAGIGVVSVTSGPLRTTYEPLRVTVHRGDAVAAGTVLGRLTLAGSHCLPAACLHWGLLRGQDYLDPLALLGLEQVRLLPLD
jgi:murein DD-endopeptidase MepM/ murein hydrolase activator NlpD